MTAQGEESDSAESMDEAIADARIICGSKPIWITETGWNVNGPNCPLDPGIVTPLAYAKYVLRDLAETYNRGIQKTSIYTFLDDSHRSPPRYAGMILSNYQTRQPYHALKNCVALFDDPGDDFAPGKLAFTLSSTGTLPVPSRLPLMQRRDGTFLLTLWQDVESYKRTSPYGDLNPPTQPVTLTFESPVDVKVWTPTTAEASTGGKTGVTSLTVDVPDHLLVIEIVP